MPKRSKTRPVEVGTIFIAEHDGELRLHVSTNIKAVDLHYEQNGECRISATFVSGVEIRDRVTAAEDFSDE